MESFLTQNTRLTRNPREGLQQRAVHGVKPDGGEAQRSRRHARNQSEKGKLRDAFLLLELRNPLLPVGIKLFVVDRMSRLLL
jgi:hypothetical protein